ncbi:MULTISPECIES: universal stress protein [unclassified Mycolicibacterium]|uniref:universal stress protein n=1 Tax=unclassified Mycolicibacterium TaxID=2636767 RepID=UPI002EDAF01F
MTVIVGFSASRQGSAPLNLAAQLARSTGEKIVAAVIVERVPAARVSPIEEQFQNQVAVQATKSLEQVIDPISRNLDVSIVVHESSSIPAGLMELVDQHAADMVVVGSSSSGLLGRVALGSVTDRLVHTAAVPVAIAPRGYPLSRTPVQRLTAAYGGAADAAGLIATTAELASRWSVRMRIASFTVRAFATFGGAVAYPAEDLVMQQWVHRTELAILTQLESSVAAQVAPLPDAEVQVGVGTDWSQAVDSIGWEHGDILLLGSGAAGPVAQVFLGTAASKILRHAPVPVMIMPSR